MTKYTYLAAWIAMTGAAVLTVASQQKWGTVQGDLVGAGLCLAALGAALMHPPSTGAQQ